MKKGISFVSMVSFLLADFRRYSESANIPFWLFLVKIFHNSGMIFSVLYRFQRYFMFHNLMIFRWLGYLLYPGYFLTTYYILDYHIEPEVEIGGGLFLHNRSIVITDNTIIGRNASIMGQVTIGTGFETNKFLIHIGDNIKIGAGAKIIAKGKLTITNNVLIGANAVVTKNITREGVYVGVPASRLS